MTYRNNRSADVLFWEKLPSGEFFLGEVTPVWRYSPDAAKILMSQMADVHNSARGIIIRDKSYEHDGGKLTPSSFNSYLLTQLGKSPVSDWKPGKAYPFDFRGNKVNSPLARKTSKILTSYDHRILNQQHAWVLDPPLKPWSDEEKKDLAFHACAIGWWGVVVDMLDQGWPIDDWLVEKPWDSQEHFLRRAFNYKATLELFQAHTVLFHLFRERCEKFRHQVGAHPEPWLADHHLRFTDFDQLYQAAPERWEWEKSALTDALLEELKTSISRPAKTTARLIEIKHAHDASASPLSESDLQESMMLKAKACMGALRMIDDIADSDAARLTLNRWNKMKPGVSQEAAFAPLLGSGWLQKRSALDVKKVTDAAHEVAHYINGLSLAKRFDFLDRLFETRAWTSDPVSSFFTGHPGRLLQDAIADWLPDLNLDKSSFPQQWRWLNVCTAMSVPLGGLPVDITNKLADKAGVRHAVAMNSLLNNDDWWMAANHHAAIDLNAKSKNKKRMPCRNETLTCLANHTHTWTFYSNSVSEEAARSRYLLLSQLSHSPYAYNFSFTSFKLSAPNSEYQKEQFGRWLDPTQFHAHRNRVAAVWLARRCLGLGRRTHIDIKDEFPSVPMDLWKEFPLLPSYNFLRNKGELLVASDDAEWVSVHDENKLRHDAMEKRRETLATPLSESVTAVTSAPRAPRRH